MCDFISKPWFIMGISLLSCFTAAAQKEAPAVRNIVLVHGAWADGSGWKGIYDILVKDGYNVSIVQEPETCLKKMSPLRSASSRYKTDHAFLSVTVTAAPSSLKRGRIHQS
jgi:hypothetical protein